ncbi:MAG: phosphate ABC transporter permease subunit PstC [Deltaproteobacteria bacterium]|nr:phosphate ABC transporter permease subunit PstC [Deltaproteobacteria bacterium]
MQAVDAKALPALQTVELSSFHKRLRIWGEKIIEALILICGLSAIILVLGIFIFVFKEAWPFLLSRFSWREFLTSPEWYPDSATKVRYGALALFAGTASITIGSMVVALPVGLGTAIYISEFCSPRFKEIAKIVIEILAAIPSVVWGFVAIMILNPLIIKLFDVPIGLNILNASVILALMAIPVIVSIGEDALRAVPDAYREAAEALGATRLETTFRVVVPAAKNGLFAALLLGMGRAIGETMAVLMATGHSIHMPTSVFDSVRTLTATIAAELGEAPKGGEHYQALFTIGLFLFAISFIVNLTADFMVRGFRRKI